MEGSKWINIYDFTCILKCLHPYKIVLIYRRKLFLQFYMIQINKKDFKKPFFTNVKKNPVDESSLNRIIIMLIDFNN